MGGGYANLVIKITYSVNGKKKTRGLLYPLNSDHEVFVLLGERIPSFRGQVKIYHEASGKFKTVLNEEGLYASVLQHIHDLPKRREFRPITIDLFLDNAQFSDK